MKPASTQTLQSIDAPLASASTDQAYGKNNEELELMGSAETISVPSEKVMVKPDLNWQPGQSSGHFV